MSGEEASGGHVLDLRDVDIGVDHNGFQRVVGENSDADCIGAAWVQNSCLEGEVGIVNAMDENFVFGPDFVEKVASRRRD